MPIARAAASTASPAISPPINRVLNGNVAAASATLTLRALGNVAEYGLGLADAPGATVGNRLPTELCGLGSSGSVPAAAGEPGVMTGRMPAGSEEPTPAGLSAGVGPAVGRGELDGLAGEAAATLIEPDAGDEAVASVDLAVADRVARLPAEVPCGMTTVAWSSSEVPWLMPPAVQVCLLATGQTVKSGVTGLPATLALMVTLTTPAAPPAGHTQMA
jgi:hypothetical protein